MSDTPEDGIGKALNVRPMTDVSSRVRAIEEQSSSKSAQTDFEMARGNIHSIISTGTDALDKIAMIAEQSQHPRAFEVLANLMKTLLDANKDLLDLQKTIRDIKKTNEDPTAPASGEPKTINNTLVVTTAEMQKMFEDMRKKDPSP
jgi:Terminase DNA packaging enzyme